MGSKKTEAGGGAATGLSEDLIGVFRSLLQPGGGGQPTAGDRFNQANPTGSTGNVMGVLSDLLSGGGGKVGGSLAQMISTKQTEDVADLRARYGATGGTAYGTPAAFAESAYRAKAAPETATAVGGLQMNALNSILPLMAALSGKGIAQRETFVEKNPVLQGVDSLAGLAQGVGAIAASSRRFKDDIIDAPVEDTDLDKLLELRPVTFRYKGRKELEAGLIAEEVEEHFPELVAYDDDGRPTGVYYSRLCVMLIHKLHELAAEEA